MSVLGTHPRRSCFRLHIDQVVNEETVLLVGFVIIAVAIGRGMASPYTAWADGHIDVSHLHNFPGADPCLIV